MTEVISILENVLNKFLTKNPLNEGSFFYALITTNLPDALVQAV